RRSKENVFLTISDSYGKNFITINNLDRFKTILSHVLILRKLRFFHNPLLSSKDDEVTISFFWNSDDFFYFLVGRNVNDVNDVTTFRCSLTFRDLVNLD